MVCPLPISCKQSIVKKTDRILSRPRIIDMSAVCKHLPRTSGLITSSLTLSAFFRARTQGRISCRRSGADPLFDRDEHRSHSRCRLDRPLRLLIRTDRCFRYQIGCNGSDQAAHIFKRQFFGVCDVLVPISAGLSTIIYQVRLSGVIKKTPESL